jgi:hypothetical protein
VAAITAGHPLQRNMVETALYGADLLYHGGPLSVWQRNHPSADEARGVVSADIAALLRDGQAIDVTPIYEAAPALPCVVSAMAVVTTPTKQRVVVDGSFPAGLCINDFVHPHAWLPMQLPSIATFAEQMWALRLACSEPILMQVYDYTAAYRTVPVRWADLWLTGVSHAGRVYWVNACNFGARGSGFVTQALTSSIARWVRASAPLRACDTYVDDSALAAPQSRFAAAEDAFCAVSRDVGFSENVGKRAKAGPPATSKKWIGWVIDSGTMRVRIDPSKLEATRKLMAAITRYGRARRVQLQSLLGKVQFLAGGVRPIRSFLDPLIRQVRTMHRHKVQALPPQLLDDIRMLSAIMRDFTSAPLPAPPHVLGPPLVATTDASNHGWGFYFPSLGVYDAGVWADNHRAAHINKRELAAAFFAIAHAISVAEAHRVQHVHVYSDNATTVSCIQRGYSVSPDLAPIVRAVSTMCATAGITVQATHIPGEHNSTADALSRGTTPPQLFSAARVHTPSHWTDIVLTSSQPWRAAQRWARAAVRATPLEFGSTTGSSAASATRTTRSHAISGRPRRSS